MGCARLPRMPSSRYRTLTIYNVFFERNKMTEGDTRMPPLGILLMDENCFYSHIESHASQESVVAQWLVHLPLELEVPDSIPAHGEANFGV